MTGTRRGRGAGSRRARRPRRRAAAAEPCHGPAGSAHAAPGGWEPLAGDNAEAVAWPRPHIRRGRSGDRSFGRGHGATDGSAAPARCVISSLRDRATSDAPATPPRDGGPPRSAARADPASRLEGETVALPYLFSAESVALQNRFVSSGRDDDSDACVGRSMTLSADGQDGVSPDEASDLFGWLPAHRSPGVERADPEAYGSASPAADAHPGPRARPLLRRVRSSGTASSRRADQGAGQGSPGRDGSLGVRHIGLAA